MAERVMNKALVTKTLVHNGSAAISQHGQLSLPLFLDFCSLCDAAVILDELNTMESADQLPGGPVTAELSRIGVLREFRPATSRLDLLKAMLRVPEELVRHFLATPLTRDDLRRANDIDPVGGVAGVVYDAGVGSSLLSQLDQMVSYPSLEASGATAFERQLRSYGYLLLSAANGMDYYPDFDRAPFVDAMVFNLYRSLPRQLYERVSDALGVDDVGKEQLVQEWTLDGVLPIPPATALVLGRCASIDEVPSRLLEVRDEFSGYRRYFGEFRGELQAAESLKERRRLHQKYVRLLADASGPDSEVVSASEVLNFAEKLITVAAASTAPTSYSGGLITQPAEWLRRWWRRRPLAILFRIDGKLPHMSEYATVIERLWGSSIQENIMSQYVTHALNVRRMMSSRGRSADLRASTESRPADLRDP